MIACFKLHELFSHSRHNHHQNSILKGQFARLHALFKMDKVQNPTLFFSSSKKLHELY